MGAGETSEVATVSSGPGLMLPHPHTVVTTTMTINRQEVDEATACAGSVGITTTAMIGAAARVVTRGGGALEAEAQEGAMASASIVTMQDPAVVVAVSLEASVTGTTNAPSSAHLKRCILRSTGALLTPAFLVLLSCLCYRAFTCGPLCALLTCMGCSPGSI